MMEGFIYWTYKDLLLDWETRWEYGYSSNTKHLIISPLHKQSDLVIKVQYFKLDFKAFNISIISTLRQNVLSINYIIMELNALKC